MKIHIDFVHLSNINFFKNLIYLLDINGHELIFTVQKRGRLPQIFKKEFPNERVTLMGKHRGTLFSIIVESNLIRFFRMFFFIVKNKPDLGLNVGSFPQEISMGILGIPNITISDDPERTYDFLFHNLFATKIFFPPIIEINGKYQTFNALKEWAYLSPKYFKPNSNVLSKYNIKEKEYIFIREVSTGSMNYIKQKENLVLTFAAEVPTHINVLLSLEDKSRIQFYPNHWLLLQEPIEDIHSLMYFSQVVISSGDSMAREAAMLGVLSVYCGYREMKANNILIDEGLLHKIEPEKVSQFITENYYKKRIMNQEIIRNKLMEKWVDVNEFLVKKINNIKRKKI